MLNVPFAKKWIEALRSGKYKQGKLFLQQDGKFCCLGVACELAGIPSIDSEAIIFNEKGEEKALVKRYGQDESAGYSPEELEQYGIDRYGYLNSVETTLVCMNDSGRSFTEIADAIEKELLIQRSPE